MPCRCRERKRSDAVTAGGGPGIAEFPAVALLTSRRARGAEEGPCMRVLLLRPDPGNERFGLGPFFRVEPLGLEYVAAALVAAGHEPAIGDLRFRPGLATLLRRHRPQVVGISCMHSLEFDRVLDLAREVKRRSPDTFVLVGGHAA